MGTYPIHPSRMTAPRATKIKPMIIRTARLFFALMLSAGSGEMQYATTRVIRIKGCGLNGCLFFPGLTLQSGFYDLLQILLLLPLP